MPGGWLPREVNRRNKLRRIVQPPGIFGIFQNMPDAKTPGNDAGCLRLVMWLPGYFSRLAHASRFSRFRRWRAVSILPVIGSVVV